MKKIKWILSLILLIGILCSCSSLPGNTNTPYLNKKERTKIEQGVLDGVEFLRDDNSTWVCFQNDLEYTLWDVDFISAETRTILFSVPQLAPGMSCELEVYGKELMESNDSANMYMKYTIGDYTYRSDLSIPVNGMDAPVSETETAYHISIITKDGVVELDNNVPVEFAAGNEIAGLNKFRINSIMSRVPYEGAIDFDVTGSRPDEWNTDLIAKLRDEDGIIVSSAKVYLSDGKGTLYCFDVNPGHYTLTFEETS